MDLRDVDMHSKMEIMHGLFYLEMSDGFFFVEMEEKVPLMIMWR